jgi:2-C-methyl-D-erythritol 2,4-cyclodiphosphate synthase
VRIGHGYDIHAFDNDPNRPLVLCGVNFPGERGLKGHSDADVALHALCDALLGAHALGDIGDHFPPGEPEWFNADSRELLRAVRELLPAGIKIENVDVTIIAERPRISAHKAEMRMSISEAIGITVDRVSVKATTNEKLGTLGRGEGIAAYATVLTVNES